MQPVLALSPIASLLGEITSEAPPVPAGAFLLALEADRFVPDAADVQLAGWTMPLMLALPLAGDAAVTAAGGGMLANEEGTLVLEKTAAPVDAAGTATIVPEDDSKAILPGAHAARAAGPGAAEAAETAQEGPSGANGRNPLLQRASLGPDPRQDGTPPSPLPRPAADTALREVKAALFGESEDTVEPAAESVWQDGWRRDPALLAPQAEPKEPAAAERGALGTAVEVATSVPGADAAPDSLATRLEARASVRAEHITAGRLVDNAIVRGGSGDDDPAIGFKSTVTDAGQKSCADVPVARSERNASAKVPATEGAPSHAVMSGQPTGFWERLFTALADPQEPSPIATAPGLEGTDTGMGLAHVADQSIRAGGVPMAEIAFEPLPSHRLDTTPATVPVAAIPAGDPGRTPAAVSPAAVGLVERTVALAMDFDPGDAFTDEGIQSFQMSTGSLPVPMMPIGTAGPTGVPTAPPILQLAAQLTAALTHSADGVTELALSPEELGHVRLRLEPDVANPDRMVVMITFERPETLDLFRRHAGDLAEALRSAGFAGADIGFGQGSGGSSGFENAPQHGSGDARADSAADPLPPAPRLVAGASLDLRL